MIARIRSIPIVLFLTLSLFAALTMSSRAADYTASDDSETGWQTSLAPYLWLPGLNGDTQAFGMANPVSVDLSPWEFGELLVDNLDFALIGAAETRRDDYGLLIDVLHLQLSGSAATPLGIVFSTANLDLKLTMATAMGAYRVAESDRGHIDLMAGARMWNVDLGVQLIPAIPQAPFVIRNDGDTWVDPMVGIKGRHRLDGPWALSGWAMVGGGASDISWDIYGAINYDVSDSFSLLAGYRAVGMDYQSNGFLFDMVMAGPLLGAVWRF